MSLSLSVYGPCLHTRAVTMKSLAYVHAGVLALRQGGVTVQSIVHVVTQEELQSICGRHVNTVAQDPTS